MPNKLSHSAISKFQTCGKAFEYHYIQKLRPNVQSGALVFGSAIDAALNELLMPTGKDPKEIFIREFTYSYINEEKTYVPTYQDLVYQTGDFDADLLTQDDYNFIEENAKQEIIERSTDYLEVYNSLKKRKSESGFDSLSIKEKKLFNLMNWLVLQHKGILMLDAYKRKVLPKLNKVYKVQYKISMSNEVGDEIVGYVDLIADVKDVGICILDNKTSSMEYDKDSVLTSSQLSLYMHILEEEYKTRKAGYIVMRKSIIKNRKKICSKCGHDGSGKAHKTCDATINGKRCHGEWNETIDPDVHIQFIIDEIPKQTESIVLENIEATNEAIKTGNFTRNFNSCHNHFGSRCPYFQKCYYGKEDGLVRSKDKK